MMKMLSWAGENARGVSLFGDPASYSWGADYQGRWLEAMTLVSRSVRLPTEEIERVAENLVTRQRRNGNFHVEANNMVLNGNSRALVALVEHYRTSGKATYLKAAQRLAEWYIRQCRPKSYNSSFLTMVLEGFVELWAETGRKSYLDYALDLVEGTFRIWSDPLPQEGHLHSMRPTNHALPATGCDCVCCSGAPPARAVISMMPREPLLNHLYFNQLPNGGYSSTCNLEQGFRGLEAWWCCSMQAPRSVLELTRYIWTHNDGALYLNFFAASRVVIPLKKNLSVTLVQETRFPLEPRSTISIFPQRAACFTLKIRIPDWAGDQPLRLRVNGSAIDGVRQGDRLTLRRRWQPGDRFEVSLPMPMRIESELLGEHEKWAAASVDLAGKGRRAKRIGLFRGPLLFVVVRTRHQNDMTWVYRGGIMNCSIPAGWREQTVPAETIFVSMGRS